MIRSFLIPFLAVLLSVSSGFSAEPNNTSYEDPSQAELLKQGRTLLDQGKPEDAISHSFDKVINYYETKYHSSKKRIYCARTKTESLGYLLDAANKNQDAVVLSDTWAAACFMKGYALLELHRRSEGKAFMEQAIELSPSNPQYLSELGYCYQLEKNWPKSTEAFKTAEKSLPNAPTDSEEIILLTRALRGQAYNLVELGKLDEGEKLYQRCLTLDPNDKTAKAELGYLHNLRKKETTEKPSDSKTKSEK